MKNNDYTRKEITQDVLRHVKAIYPNITHEHLASILGMDRSTVTNWFNGKRAISMPLLVKLAETLNVSLDFLVFGTDLLDDTVDKINRLLISSQLETVYVAKDALQKQEKQLLKLKEKLLGKE